MSNLTDKKSFISHIESTAIDISAADLALIKRAYDYGSAAHAGQLRASGSDYFTDHCLPVAYHVLELGMDANLISAALLHDTIEDTATTVEDIRQNFGNEIAILIEGVTKLDKVQYFGNERHVESLRKFFISVAQDLRVVILKLADRWHNLETLEYLDPGRQKHIAVESIMIFAPLASRLGMGKLVSTINDLAFPYAYPEDYQKTKTLMDDQIKKSAITITKMYRDLTVDLHQALGYSPIIDKRIKGIYSLYKKLERYNWDVETVYDLVALRAIVKTLNDCYQALGAVHEHWRPVPNRIKDFIAVPKPNGYQSLHTAVFSGDGLRVEIQIRTAEMHEFDEYGIASHHSYKMDQLNTGNYQESFAWINQLREFQKAKINPSDYLKRLELDFIHDRLFVFTPKGDVVDLPIGATVLDFAYAIHSRVGEHAIGGRIDGKYVGLKTILTSENIVEIVTSPKVHPTIKWLDQCITSSALNKIRGYVNKSHELI
jgi:guanosine-3',5'-bis(diphosphate) 3'-pyrophosphohydrolase